MSGYGSINTPGNLGLWLTGGNNTLLSNNSEAGIQSVMSYTLKKAITIGPSIRGVIRVYFELKSMNSAGANIAYARIYINGVPVGIERTNNDINYVGFSEDITVKPLDVIQIYAKVNTAGYWSYVKNFRIKSTEILFSANSDT